MYSRTKRGGGGLFIYLSATPARGAICVLTFKIVNTLIKNNVTRRYIFHLDMGSTHGQPAPCLARPVNVDDGLEDIMWIRGLGGER